MAMGMLVTWTACLLTLITECVSRELSDEERLWKELFREYNPSARPVMNSSSTVMVSIQFSLMHIKELDVRSQVLTTTGLLILEWRDERLQWATTDFGNLTELIVEASYLWRPEFAVINGAENIYESYSNFRAIVSSNGRIRWEPGGVFKTMCQIDITYYPFDDQLCEMTFGAWSYHTSKMNLTNSGDIINLDSYKINGEWEITATAVIRNEFNYECCPDERFSNVNFNVYMRRRHTFYIMNVIVPSILTSVLLLSVFFCTPGQKVQIGVVVLLSFRIFLLNVADNIPKTSDHIPLLGIYLTCTMAITTLSMVLTVFVLNLHHITDRPVPGWVKKMVLIYLAKVLGVCAPDSNYSSKNAPLTRGGPTGHFNTHYRKASVRMENEGPGGERLTVLEVHAGRSNSLGNCHHASAFPNESDDSEAGESRRQGRCADRSTSSQTDFSKEWRKVAEVFDRLFFWLFLLAILTSTLVLFHPLTDSYLKQPTFPK